MNHDPVSLNDHERFMAAALGEALQAYEAGEVPVGAVVVRAGKIISRGFNQRESLSDPTAHAEMIAITSGASAVGNWRLSECTLYVTLEPCPMCAGAIVLARLPRLVYGATDPKGGACGTLYEIPTDRRLNHHVEVISGIRGDECGQVLTQFFSEQRAQGKK